jgi:hypothetical protein
MKKSAIVLAIGTTLGFGSAIAETINVSLVGEWFQGPGIGSPSSADIGLSTATWSYDTLTGVVSGNGLYIARSQINPLPSSHLFTRTISNLAVGGGNAATAASYSCVDGAFGPSVGAHLCGNYNFGGNFVNDSTLVYGPGTSFSRTIGGDDAAVGTPQNLSQYDGMTADWDGTTLFVSNYDFDTGGYNMTFVEAVPIPAAAWLFSSALGLLSWIRHKRA